MARTGRRSSSRKTFSDDIDAITPCPQATHPNEASSSQAPPCTVVEDMQPSRSPSPSSCSESEHTAPKGTSERRNSIKTLEEGTEGDPERLWKRMLALQQTYGCYRSARMSAALELGDYSCLLPSKVGLDLMNADMHALPDDVEAAFKHGSTIQHHGSKVSN
ncbi:hypothetical protein BKA67DRAFT_542599 [Truncatella angustata]|uniref:Uncharacterized protein n=1 Tax=Truncatella angustata TaxID=152316 RepID=A0A9P8REP1_9PEZI|nr:uncharacterized protein BKA67DRAFT_542599 [Truncatella angustata]KAH6640074.1 hypothetical protein BKA67DRAFT_542599 [Truncatella angustata]KAH8193837.1 hypothetical protein TruAng_012000 [Truncatella angustata]